MKAPRIPPYPYTYEVTWLTYAIAVAILIIICWLSFHGSHRRPGNPVSHERIRRLA